MESERDSAFELCDKIESIGIIYGRGRVHVMEFNSSRRLLKELHRLGRARIPIRGMVSRCGALAIPSLRALNCYLEHRYAEFSLNALRAGRLHRYAWFEIQRAVDLHWIP